MPSEVAKPYEEVPFELDLLGVVRRRWKHILFGFLVGVAFALMYQLSATKIYESDLEILVGQRSSEMTTSGSASTASASGDSIQVDQLATHMQLFSSRRTIKEAIERADLKKVNSVQSAIKKGIHPIDHILKHLDVQRGGKGAARDAMVIRASFSDPVPEDAANVLQAIYESYRDYVESHVQNTSNEAISLIESAHEVHEQELTEADQQYRTFVASVPVLLEGDRVRDIHKDRLENLERELNQVRSSLAQSKSRLEIIEKYLSEPSLIEDTSTAHLALLSQKEVERLQLFLDMTRGEAQSEAFQAEQPARQEAAKAQYTRLLTLLQTERTMAEDFGPNHPLVAATQKEIEVIQNFILHNAPPADKPHAKKLDPKEMLSTYVLLMRNDIEELEKREGILIRDSAKELLLAKSVEADFMKGSSLKSRLQRAQSRYDEVIRRLQELNLAGAYAGFSTDLLASPEIEQKPAWPRGTIVLALGGILGMIMGISLAFASEVFDSTFRDAKDLEYAVGAPAIAHIPRIHLRSMQKSLDPETKLHAALVAFHMPRSPESEIYRVARTSLMVKCRQDSIRKMMMTSPNPGDGKSTTISNLAISFAQVGKKVLLIDADMRRPVIAGMFGIAHQPGLTDALLELNELNECFHQSESPNLTILPHGTRTASPAELLESNQLSTLLAQCEQQFDLVMIDAPPLLAVADPAIIAPQVDAIVLTVRIRKNGRRPVERAARILNEIDCAPAALIINATEKKSSCGYGYSHGYASEEYSYVGYYNEYAVDSEKENQKKRELEKLKTPKSSLKTANY